MRLELRQKTTNHRIALMGYLVSTFLTFPLDIMSLSLNSEARFVFAFGLQTNKQNKMKNTLK